MTAPQILHVTRDFPPQHSGGLSTAVAGLADAQQVAGIPCLVVSFDDYRSGSSVPRDQLPVETQTNTNIPVVRINVDTKLEGALRIATRSSCTIVHVHHEALWEFAREAAAILQAPTVYSVHLLQNEQDRLRGTQASRSSEQQSQVLREADALHLPSKRVATLLEQTHPGLANKSTTIRLARAEIPHARDRRRNCESGLVTAHGPLLAYVGRFADMCGFQQFLEALPPLFAKSPSLRAVAAGGLPGNPRGEERWRKRWAKMAGDKADRLTMPGWLDEMKLTALYHRASILVVPSWFETFGQVVLEGMLHRTPIVTTAAGAIAELVDEESALIIETKSSMAIVDAVLAVLNNPEEAQRRCEHAFAIASEGYFWSDRMPAFLALYQNLIDRK